jgi:hypothetical protein
MNRIAAQLNRLQKTGFAAGILFLIVSGIGLAVDRRHFFVSYLFAFLFWIGLSFGCFNTALMLYLTGGRWGNGTRRFLEAGFMTLPLMALFFVPILFGLSDLYPWARPELVAADKVLRHRAVYENTTGFLGRAIFCFAIWITMAVCLRKWSLRQDTTNAAVYAGKMRTLSGPGMVIVPFTLTFALVDWVLSIESAWFSTIFAVVLLASQIVVAFGFVIVLLAWLQPRPPFDQLVTDKDFLDLGNLLLAFVMFWTYVSFSQFLIIYSGNQPAEITWYLHRTAGGWKWLIALIALFYFFVPFFLLLFRAIKQDLRRLAAVASLVLLVHVLMVYWTIAPTFYPRLQVHWTDFSIWLGMGGIWLGVFATNLKNHPLVAHNSLAIETSLGPVTHAK